MYQIHTKEKRLITVLLFYSATIRINISRQANCSAKRLSINVFYFTTSMALNHGPYYL